jgi:hypothetical protein
VLNVTNSENKQRRPACGQCGGSGYVYLWSVPRAGPRTWFCDRCKRSWLDGEPSLAQLIGTQVGVPAAVPVLATGAQQPLEPAMNGGHAAEPSQPRPRRLRVIEPNLARVARGARPGDDAPSSASSTAAPLERLPL